MTPKTLTNLLAIALFLGSVAAPAAGALTSEPLPLPGTPAPASLPGLPAVLPTASAAAAAPGPLCQWSDAGLAAHAPASDGATFLAFGAGAAALLVQVTPADTVLPGTPLAGCAADGAAPCSTVGGSPAYAVLHGEVLCFTPTAPFPPAGQALPDGVCQLAAGVGATLPSCPAPAEPAPSEPAPAAPGEDGSGEEAAPGAPDAAEPDDCPLDKLLSETFSTRALIVVPCVGDVGDIGDGPCVDCIDPCNVNTFTSASSGAVAPPPATSALALNTDCLPTDYEVCPGGGFNCILDADPCGEESTLNCPPCVENTRDCNACNGDCVEYVCSLLTSGPDCSVDPLPCGGGGSEDDCATWVCDAVARLVSSGSRAALACGIDDPELCPSHDGDCVAWACDAVTTPDCDVGPLPCGSGTANPDCVAWLCSLLTPSATRAAEDCGAEPCPSHDGDCVAWACDAVTTPDCQINNPCGTAGKPDCLAWLCDTLGLDATDCDPLKVVGPVVEYVVLLVTGCLAADHCLRILEVIERLLAEYLEPIWPLVNEAAQLVLDCATRGDGEAQCEQVRQALQQGLDLVDDATLGVLGIVQQCAAETRGDASADSPADCERLGEPGALVQRHLDNVLFTINGLAATVDACAANLNAQTPCQAPCEADCEAPCSFCEPCGPEGCGPPVTVDRAPPLPDLPARLGRTFEVTLPDDGPLPEMQGGDVDGDGLPDLLDPVNLPSEAQRWTGDDRVTLPQGLGQGGFLLMVEPSHQEAQLFLADGNAFEPVATMDPATALDILAVQHGRVLSNALAAVLHEDIVLHVTWVGLDAAIDQPLSWTQPLPADGTWLVVRNDPTRPIQALRLGGLDALPALPSTSHYTLLGLQDYRWEFLNLQGLAGFCFDAAGLHGVLPCRGDAGAGWLRAYSGQAAFSLRSVHAGLDAGLVPVAADVEASLPVGAEAGGAHVRFRYPSTGPLPWPFADAADRHDIDGDGRTAEPNGQDDSVEPTLYVDPDEEFPDPDDLFSGAAAGFTMRALPSAGADSALTIRLGDVAGTAQRELLVAQAADAAQSATVCVVSVGNGAAVHQAAAAFRSDPAQPCGADVTTWTKLLPVGDLLGGVLAGWAMDAATEPRPLFVLADEDRNNVPEALVVSLPDPTSCATDTHACTAYRTLRVPLGDAAFPDLPAETPPLLPPPAPTYIGSEEQDDVDVFDPSSHVHLLGTESRRLPDSVGTDYLLAPRGQATPEPMLLQWPMPSTPGAPDQRLFHFTGSYINMPGEPRDLTQVRLLLQPADGNETGRDFLLNGRVLGSYLDLLSNETMAASVDAPHAEGFTQRLLDADGDGWLDLLVHIPHFSQVELVVKRAADDPDGDFWEIHLTGGPLTGWISGSYGAVYRLDDGVLRREPVDGLSSDRRTLGMHMVSDSEFYVVTTGARNGWCHDDADTSPAIAHYINGFWDVFPLSAINPGSFDCDDLHDIWMSPSGSLGYAGGTEGLWMRYQGGQWLARPRGTSCGIMDIEFGSSGTGYVAVAKADAQSCPGTQGSPLMYFDGNAFQTQSVPNAAEMFDVSPDGTWAVGMRNSVYYNAGGGTWFSDSYSPRGSFEGADRDASGAMWIAGWDQARCWTCTLLGRFADGYWSSVDINGGIDRMRDIDMRGASEGAAIGNNAVVVISPPARIDIYDSVSPTYGYADTVFTAQDHGSTSTVPGGVTHQWSWGDGTSSTGASATHRYTSLGTRDVTHTVTDSKGNVNSRSHSVTVDAEWLGNVPTTVTRSMPGGTAASTHYYSVTYPGHLWVRAELTAGDASLRLRGNVGGFEGIGSWPYEGASERVLEGPVPNWGTLYVAVDRPQGTLGGSYTLRFTEVVPPNLSEKMTPGLTPPEASYLDRVRFAVTWTSSDGLGPSTTPQLILGQTSYTMRTPAGALNFVAGVTYSYELELPAGKGYRPIYKATFAGQDHIDVGQPVTVTRDSIAHHDFTGDALGRVPSGFNPVTPAGKCCNYWHVTDSNDARFPSTVQAGRHGKVAWFAHQQRGDYASASSQQPAGALETPAYDLRLATRPTMSFASYYETQDLGATDRMTVRMAWKDPSGGSWSGWETLDAIDGEEGGYLQWRSQAYDLSGHDRHLVKFQFLFEASQGDNGFLGWMIDDVSVGTDIDADLLPDRLERNRMAPVQAQSIEAPLTAGPGQSVEAVLFGFQHLGGERAVAEIMTRSATPRALSFEIGAVPVWETDGLGSPSAKRVLVTLPANFAAGGNRAICGQSGPVQQRTATWHDELGMSLFGSPYGFPNPPRGEGTYVAPPTPPVIGYQEAAGVGMNVQVDLTPCLAMAIGQGASFGAVPLDVYVRLANGGGKAATLDFFRVVAYGRTSALAYDSDHDGAGDAEDIVANHPTAPSGTRSTGAGNDADHDGTPAPYDVDDEAPTAIPALDIDLSRQHREITFKLSNQFKPTTGRFMSEGRELPLDRKGVEKGWTTWTVRVPSSDSLIVADFTDTTGLTLHLELRRVLRDDVPVVDQLRYSFRYPSYSIHRTWEYDLASGGFETMHLIVALRDVAHIVAPGVDADMIVGDRYGEIAWSVGIDVAIDVVADFFIGEVKKDMKFHAVAVREVGSGARVTTPWTDPAGGKHGYMHIVDGKTNMGGASTGEVVGFLTQSGKRTYDALGQNYRWIRDTGGQTLIVTGDSSGLIKSVTKVQQKSLDQMMGRDFDPFEAEAPAEMISLERLMGQALYNKPGDYAKMPCHMACFATPGGSPIYADGSFVEATGTGDSRGLVTGGIVSAMRDGYYGQSKSCCDTVKGSQVLGMESLVFAYRMADTPDSTSKSDAFVSHWGKRSDNEDCITRPGDRRCMKAAFGTQASAPTSGVQPFDLKWLRSDGVHLRTDLVASGSYYWHWKYAPVTPAAGATIVEDRHAKTDKAVQDGGYSLVGKTKVVTSFDLTGPVEGGPNEAWQDYRLGRFGHKYG